MVESKGLGLGEVGASAEREVEFRRFYFGLDEGVAGGEDLGSLGWERFGDVSFQLEGSVQFFAGFLFEGSLFGSFCRAECVLKNA